MTVALPLVGALLLVLFAGLLSALDAALSVTSRADLVELASEGRGSRPLAHLAGDPDGHAHALVLLRVLAETAAVVLATTALSTLWPTGGLAPVVTVAAMTLLVFVAVASSPRGVGRRHATALLRGCAPVARAAGVVLGPVARLLVVVGDRVTPGGGRRGFDTEEQLLSMLDEAASHDLIEADDRDLIHSVFDFTDRIVRAVMVPRTEMVTVDAGVAPRDAVRIFLDSGRSRLPVIDGEVDDVIGVLYLKDLVQHALREGEGGQSGPVRALARPAVFVPEQMRAETLLQQMKRDAVHVCLVVDEYGGIAGLVTLEDLIEELVGEISDEYDVPTNEVVELADGSMRVSASLGLDEVGDLFGVELDDDDVDSVGGLLGKLLGRVPQPGESATAAGLSLTGGTSRGRGRGIATVIVERTAALRTAAEVRARAPRTDEIRLPDTAPRKDATDD